MYSNKINTKSIYTQYVIYISNENNKLCEKKNLLIDFTNFLLISARVHIYNVHVYVTSFETTTSHVSTTTSLKSLLCQTDTFDRQIKLAIRATAFKFYETFAILWHVCVCENIWLKSRMVSFYFPYFSIIFSRFVWRRRLYIFHSIFMDICVFTQKKLFRKSLIHISTEPAKSFL